jgi:hypothetical protein
MGREKGTLEAGKREYSGGVVYLVASKGDTGNTTAGGS